LHDAVRSMRVLNRMNAQQAKELKIDRPRFFFRSDNGKGNLRPEDKADWHRLCNVDLPNGDQVGVVEVSDYPDPLARITVEHMRQVRARAVEGNYRKAALSPDWIGNVVAEVADLDLDEEADKKTIKAALKKWFTNGVLAEDEREDEKRRPRKFVVPGDWKE
jgi:hypothetical protein